MKHNSKIALLVSIVCFYFSCSTSASEQTIQSDRLYNFDTKELGSSNMEITIQETQHENDVSLINEKVIKRGSYAGAIMFKVCSLRTIAIKRGFKYFVLLGDKKLKGCAECEWYSQNIIGFLNDDKIDLKNKFPSYYDSSEKNEITSINEFSTVCQKVENICSW